MGNIDKILDKRPLGANLEETDSEQKVFAYDSGGVPWYLLLLYLSFLAFFTWYVLGFQLPDYLTQGPGQGGEPQVRSTL
ncbi:MAG: hypothetical protein H6828_10955 [Planctomycetes bacterium]|nr:hypothetical protein [Planctomycetota bacterium]